MKKVDNTNPQPQQQVVIVNQNNSNGCGTAGLVFAIIGLFTSWIPVLGWVIWFLGFLLSFIGLFKRPRGGAIVGILFSIIDFIILIAVVGVVGGAIGAALS